MKQNLVLSVLVATIVACSGSVETPAVSGPLAADTPSVTVLHNTFVAPEGWNLSVRGPMTLLEAPEPGSRIALVDVEAEDGEQALATALEVYAAPERPLRVATEDTDRDGWSHLKTYSYQTSPNEHRSFAAGVMFSGKAWTVWIYDMADDVGQKRGAQVALVFDRLLPEGYSRESFAGRSAHELDAERLDELSRFVENALEATGVPGAAVGIIQNGETVLARGFGVRTLAGAEPPDADTLFMIASNTKALTTLLLARLVDEGRFTWTTPVTELLPGFRLGDDATTESVLVEHLVCACTGLPRQDWEWLMEFEDLTPESAMETLATMQPTTAFGELFQYSNPLAAAAGFVAGHVLYPELDLGTAYDQAMQREVFDPLGMDATTFDYARARSGNHASAHSIDLDGEPAPAVAEVNDSIIPVRPAGAAWSSVNDILKYVGMELEHGLLPDGERYVSESALVERQVEKVAVGADASYGMGLMVDRTWGVTVVHHGGDMIGFHSDMMWLPEFGVGAVVLTNGDPGWLIRSHFQRKLLEVLFDGENEAGPALAAASASFHENQKADAGLLDLPADADAVAALASRYANPALGELLVVRHDDALVFDFGGWASEVASRQNPDGTISFVTIAPGMIGIEFLVGTAAEPSLIFRDAQHEYVFEGVG